MTARNPVFPQAGALLGAACLAALAAGGQPSAAEAPAGAETALGVQPAQNSRVLPPYEVFELTFRHEQPHDSPFFDVSLEVTFTAPNGQRATVGGFFFGSSSGPTIATRQERTPSGGERRRVEYQFAKQDLWKARFAPTVLGRWVYTYVFACRHGKQTGQGAFECVRGRGRHPGFVRRHPANPFRWVFDDGSPYFPIGLQECLGDNTGLGTLLAAMSLEGPFRQDRAGRPTPPPGALFRPGPAFNPVNADVYFRRYAQAGFNLFRCSQANCSYNLYRDLDHYLIQEAVMTDELLRQARRYGMRVFYGLFGFQAAFNEQPDNAEGMAKVKRFVKYSVDRWGAEVDFWEFLNEQKADARWYEVLAPYLRSVDPYRHPIATSWERPELPGIEINAPHWYAGIADEFSPDRQTADLAAAWKRFHKPVVVGEHGNTASREQLQTPGLGGVWDPKSALRMRLRNWTALFQEIVFIFWNTSYAKDGHSMNLWIGPRERQYVHALQDFAYCLDKDVRPAPVTLSLPQAVRAYALASAERAAVYLHHGTDHTNPVTNLTLTLTVPQAARAYWYAPESADILAALEVPSGPCTFRAPSFVVDLALLVTPGNPPDSDRDGIPNDRDLDDDNDGVPDRQDAFPLEAEEWADQDGDLIGDNLDADVDADGVGDDKNRNGRPDCEEPDLDGDGVQTAEAVPWDAFPLDPKEWRDTDGDGIGDNADPDDDNDLWPDTEEIKAGTDPLSPISFPPQASSSSPVTRAATTPRGRVRQNTADSPPPASRRRFWSTASSVPSKSSLEKGLARKSSAPRAMARLKPVRAAWPLMRTNGMSAVARSCRTCLSSSQPSMPPRSMSLRIRSGGWVWTKDSAFWALSTVRTIKPRA